jgi:hypothetical protein
MQAAVAVYGSGATESIAEDLDSSAAVTVVEEFGGARSAIEMNESAAALALYHSFWSGFESLRAYILSFYDF